MATTSSRIMSTETEAKALVKTLTAALPGALYGYVIHPVWAGYATPGYAPYMLTINGVMTSGAVGSLIDDDMDTAAPKSWVMGNGGFPIPVELTIPAQPQPHDVSGSGSIPQQGTGQAVFGGVINGAPGSLTDILRQIVDLASKAQSMAGGQ